jgi:hypothetical protein
MKTTRFYKIMIVLLVLINLTTLASIWWHQPPPPPPHPGEKPQLATEIGLQGAAKSRVDKLEIAHHKEKQALLRKDRTWHKEYFALIGTEKSADSLLRLIQTNKEEIESMTFDFFDQVAAECDPAQLEKLRSFIEDKLLEISGRPGPPRPPHP